MKKAVFVLIGLVALTITLTGCQTTQSYKQQVTSLSSQVQTLEMAVDQKDKEIDSLKSQVDQLSQQAVSKNKVTATGSVTTDNKDHLGIIRVPVKVTDVQSALKAAGFYTGNIDGKVGPNTISAIGAFQNANSLKADSIVGAKTWEILKTYLSN
ncbi:MAG: peptidoglycan-binding protein [Candidatus Omnitrophota bacterium]